LSTHGCGNPSSAPPYAPLPAIRKIVALRPSAVGDFVFALPALHALRHTYPDAQIVYVGKQWHADFLHQRPGPVDRVVVIPPVPGVGVAPDAQVPPKPVQDFIAAMRSEQFDLAIQMFGGGRYSNPFVAGLGAGLTIGAHTPDALRLDRSIAYGDFNQRRLELLDIVALAGATAWRYRPELELTDSATAARRRRPCRWRRRNGWSLSTLARATRAGAGQWPVLPTSPTCSPRSAR
jgi:hypothetical protein